MSTGCANDEDFNGNTRLDRDSGYSTNTIDLKDTGPDFDVVWDYENAEPLAANGIAWRKYSSLLGHSRPITDGVEPNSERVTDLRFWYKNDAPGAANELHVQFSGLRSVK